MKNEILCNKDVPVEAIVKNLLIENKNLKSKISELKQELSIKNNAIKSFKKWQSKVRTYKLGYWLVNDIKLLEPPMSDDSVKLITKLLGNFEHYKTRLRNLENAYNTYLKCFNEAKENKEIQDLINRIL